ncbi:MarR family transcriptional regulator [Bradyrhizobium sp. 83012]|uniref:MarR family transcriptional regulator n=1 Tax=Bradyrhizobium aeschynomenes TaxID=2734909 RepID=A0ABX2CNG5_9BRAD|nr:MarR family transcriptional regulator [Bradyrhizobium aeschynomenes]NPU13737.1 MarR family transcriptional regulator [Bradyrhizobium aeschynomenes]NPU68960.1 MarR family transcriptional regulator [Bradyrhizobium aeschynomenes]NPV22592.1 MarR family transcriptional regulator [Bradyrhizobium aeschynomenes]
MAPLNNTSAAPVEAAAQPQTAEHQPKNRDAIIRFAREIATINVHLEELRYFWAKRIGISGPQWMILMAIAELDRGEGVAVNAAAKRLHVDPSFVTTQSKLLEKKGFMLRRPASNDARVVLMSLTSKTSDQFAELEAQQLQIFSFIFEEFDAPELATFTDKLAGLKERFEKASARLSMGL